MASRNEIQYIRFYTDGSAARKIAPGFSGFGKISQPKVSKKKRLRVYVDPVAILSIAVAVCLVICMCVAIGQSKTAQQQTQQLQQYVQQLSEQNTQLKDTYKNGYDLEAVEETALALGMIPREQAQRITLEVIVLPQEQTVTLWTRIGTFLAGLLA